MGRAPCCDKQGLKKGPWTTEEDRLLVDYIQAHGHGIWRSLPKQAGLLRCGKSCRLRWINYLRPGIKRGAFTPEEEESIVHLHGIVGNKWSAIAAQLPGRTDNEVKNYWNTHLRKGRHAPCSPSSALSGSGGIGSGAPFSSTTRHTAQWESARLEVEIRLARERPLLLASHSNAAPASSARVEAAPDFFLRIWHSEVGEAFRGRDGVASTGASPASSSTPHGSAVTGAVREEVERSGTVGTSVIGGEAQEGGDCKLSSVSAGGMRGEVGGGVAGADSPGSNETGEETYEMCVDLAGEGMALSSLLQVDLGSFFWMGDDPGEVTYLETTFK